MLTNVTNSLKLTRPAQQVRKISSLRFDTMAALFSAWLIGGLYLDGWAHHNVAALETFFTPWHAVLYSGFLAVAGLLVITWIRGLIKGCAWQSALPTGYGLSLLGILVFAVGGGGDMVWHILFGIEEDVEALLSPTHLMLALGAGLIISGPFRASWRRSKPGSLRSWRSQGPMLVSVTLLLSLFTFFTQFAHPLVDAWATTEVLINHKLDALTGQTMGAASILLQTVLLVGFVLFTLQRWSWTLPPGGLTFIIGLNATFLSALHTEFRLIPAAVLAGVMADLLLTRIAPSAKHLGRVRFFALAVPLVFYLLYFTALIMTGDIWWSAHMWLGSVVLAGLTGWLASFAFVPPPAPVEPAV